MKLWTAWSDYHATGEGRTLMARIGYAENEQDALAAFGRSFSPFYAADALEGVQQNEVTQMLFSPQLFKRAQEMEGRANVEIVCKFHFNFA